MAGEGDQLIGATSAYTCYGIQAWSPRRSVCLPLLARWIPLGPQLPPLMAARALEVADQCCAGSTRATCNFSLFPLGQMVRPDFLSCLLLLPLGTCFPLLDREVPVDAAGGTEGEMSWADLVGGHAVHLPWGSSQWQRAPHPQALLVMAKELQMLGRARAGFRLRFGRQDDGHGVAGFLLADGGKTSSPLETLAEELGGYSRKKGGFGFRFGRR